MDYTNLITGVFSDTTETQVTQNSISEDTTQSFKILDFNAANSNAIYGSSETVQPPALSLIPQIKY